MKVFSAMLFATLATLGFVAPGLGMTAAPSTLSRSEQLQIREQMHELGYATVLGIEQRQDLMVVETVDLEGPVTVVLNANSGQILHSYRTTATALDTVALPVMELSSQRVTLPDLRISGGEAQASGLPVETILPAQQRYGAAQVPYINLTLARF